MSNRLKQAISLVMCRQFICAIRKLSYVHKLDLYTYRCDDNGIRLKMNKLSINSDTFAKTIDNYFCKNEDLRHICHHTLFIYTSNGERLRELFADLPFKVFVNSMPANYNRNNL